MEEFKPPGSNDEPGQWKGKRVVDPSLQEVCHRENSKIIPIQKVPYLRSFRSNRRTVAFQRRFFAEITSSQWNDWRWQLRHRIRDIDSLSRILRLSGDEQMMSAGCGKQLPMAITPYYASLLDEDNPLQPLRRTVVPVTAEYFYSSGEAEDPLGEEHHSPLPGLVHRYPDRILFLVTDFCATYCRYCTRSRLVGKGSNSPFNEAQLERAIAYIEESPTVRDVLLSGGDPFTLSDEKLEWLLSRLRRIPHVEFLRIGTKVPVVLPQRITPGLARMLKRYHPLWISIHFTHPDELTPEVNQACERLADVGIPLGSQTVLLAGVNDNVETMKRLMHGLLQIRVRPYYLYQCDPISGSAHFRTPVAKGMEIMQGLRGHTTGYAVPTYVIDAPGGGGKIPLLPRYLVGRDGGDLLLKNYEGHIYRYPDPGSNLGSKSHSNLRGIQDTGKLMRIGITYDLREDYIAEGFSEEETAEFDRDETIQAIQQSLQDLSCETDRIGNIKNLTRRLVSGDRWDMVFNIAEGLRGFGREAQVPALLEAYDIPYAFSDPMVLSLTLHKGVAKRVVRDLGVPTPDFYVIEKESDVAKVDLPFPLFAKPVAEGTGKGINAASKTLNQSQLISVCTRLLTTYKQPVLIETFLPGREFTVGIIGSGTDATAIGVLEVILRENAEPDVYSYLNKERYEDSVEYLLANDAIAEKAKEVALAVWRGLGCRDAGRIDLRADADGMLNFMEVNPLPGLHPQHSDLCIIAHRVGMAYRALIEAIIYSAITRIHKDQLGTGSWHV